MINRTCLVKFIDTIAHATIMCNVGKLLISDFIRQAKVNAVNVCILCYYRTFTAYSVISKSLSSRKSLHFFNTSS